MQSHKYNVIKINREKSGELIKKRSLLFKLLALKADDRETDREELLKDLFDTAAKMKM